MLIVVKHGSSRKIYVKNRIHGEKTPCAHENRSRDGKSLASETRGTRDAFLPARALPRRILSPSRKSFRVGMPFPPEGRVDDTMIYLRYHDISFFPPKIDFTRKSAYITVCIFNCSTKRAVAFPDSFVTKVSAIYVELHAKALSLKTRE